MVIKVSTDCHNSWFLLVLKLDLNNVNFMNKNQFHQSLKSL